MARILRVFLLVWAVRSGAAIAAAPAAFEPGTYETLATLDNTVSPRWSILKKDGNYSLYRLENGVEEHIPLTDLKKSTGFPGLELHFEARVESIDPETGRLAPFHFEVTFAEDMEKPPQMTFLVQVHKSFQTWSFNRFSKLARFSQTQIEARDFPHCLDFGSHPGWALCFTENLKVELQDRATDRPLKVYVRGPSQIFELEAKLERFRLKGKKGQFNRRLRFLNSTQKDLLSPMGQLIKNWKELQVAFDETTGEALGITKLKLPLFPQLPMGWLSPEFDLTARRAPLRTELLPSDIGESRGTAVQRSLGLNVAVFDLTAKARKETPFARALVVQSRNASFLVGLLAAKGKAPKYTGELRSYHLPQQSFVAQRFILDEKGVETTLRVYDSHSYRRGGGGDNISVSSPLELKVRETRLPASLDFLFGVDRPALCAPWTPAAIDLICLIRKENNWLLYIGNPRTQNHQLYPLELSPEHDPKDRIYRVAQRTLWLNLPALSLMSIDSILTRVRFQLSGGTEDTPQRLSMRHLRADFDVSRSSPGAAMGLRRSSNPLVDEHRFDLSRTTTLALCEARATAQ